MPVIISTPSIKNYSQTVPKWEKLQNIDSTTAFQNYCYDVETTTISNAIIIPLPLLRIFLTTEGQEPADIALRLLNEMKCLDSLQNNTTKPDLSPSKKFQDLDTLSTISCQESYLEHCGYIIQWLSIAMSNRIKPVRYSIAQDATILHWFNNSNPELPTNNVYKVESMMNQSTRNHLLPLMTLPPLFHQSTTSTTEKLIETTANCINTARNERKS